MVADYDTLESSVESSRPIELYEFTFGTASYYYTSAEDDLTPASSTFLAVAIARSAIGQGSDQENRNVTITMPANLPLPQEFVSVPPRDQVTVNIYRYQRDESPAFDTQVLQFKGTVQSCRFVGDGTTAELTVRSIETALNRNMPRFTFSGMCNHVLYDDRCQVSISGKSHTGTVTAGGATTSLTVSGLSASGKDVVGGFATPTTVDDFRLIISQSGDVIEVLLPFQEDVSGLSLQCYQGCDHVLTGDCITTYANEINFGAFAFVPNKDLFATGLD